MDHMTRRRFLMLSGVAGAGALGFGATQVRWDELFTEQDTNTASHPVLVVVTLYGGNDGLNTIVPASDPIYQDSRPELAYQPEEVLDLGDGLGLNPGMTGLKTLWDERRLAVVRGIGYPDPNHSHFTSMAIWQTASPRWNGSSGWLGRWLDVAGDDPLVALSLEPTLPPLLAGERRAAASLPINTIPLPTGTLGEAFRGLGVAQDGEEPLRARRRVHLAPAHAAGGDRPDTRRGSHPGCGGAQRPAGLRRAARGGRAQLARVLRLPRRLRHPRRRAGNPGGATHPGGLGTRTVRAADAHHRAGSPGRRHGLLGVRPPSGRKRQPRHRPWHRRSAVRTRRARPGGFYGAQPSLADLADGDLKATSDFRDVYASLLDDVLGTDAGQILDNHRGRLDGLLADATR